MLCCKLIQRASITQRCVLALPRLRAYSTGEQEWREPDMGEAIVKVKIILCNIFIFFLTFDYAHEHILTKRSVRNLQF